MYHMLGRGEVHVGFWSGKLREGDHLEDPGIDGRIILQCIFEKPYGMEQINLAQDRDRWWTAVYAAVSLWVP
jgi:hypothetical protein